jgi:hypothetical protein
LLVHINALSGSIAQGVGIDYNASLLETAGINSDKLKDVNIEWLTYNFNDDKEDLVAQLIAKHHVTHVFIYLTPKQLALQTVKKILTRFCGEAVVLCCHKFFPLYLEPAKRDTLMELNMYDETSGLA